MKNNKIRLFGSVFLLCIITVFLCAGIIMKALSPKFPTSLLLFISIIVCLIGYKHIKKKQKYQIRSFSEIVDSVLSAGWGKQLMVLACLSIGAFVISWALVDSVTQLQWNDEGLEGHSFWLTICYFFDPGNLNLTDHFAPGLQGGISLIVAVLGMTILTGLFISTFTNIIEKRVEDVEAGNVTYSSISGHTVVIGYCNLTESVIRGTLERVDDDYKVILLTNHDMTEVRKALYNLMHNEMYDGQVVLYTGDYRFVENLERLNLSKANKIYILGDDGIDSRDFENLACAQKISKIITDEDCPKSTPTPMYVRMDRIHSFSTLQRLDIQSNFFAENVYFRPFNYYEHWTHILWTKKEVNIYDITGSQKHIEYPSLCFDRSPDARKYIHLVVSGFSQMGMALTLSAVRGAHFGNFTEDNNLRTRITIVDPRLDTLRPIFESQYQNINQVYDVEVEYRGEFLEDMTDEIVEWSCDRQQMLTIAICQGDADRALSQALNLPLEVYYQQGRTSNELPQILVRQKSLSGVWKMLENKEHNELTDKVDNIKAFRKTKYNKYHNLHPYGMLVSSFYPGELDDMKPSLVYADYSANWGDGNKYITISQLYELVQKKADKELAALIKEALTKWHRIPENEKWANRYQTNNHHILLDYLHDNDIHRMEDISKASKELIGMLCDIEHRRWVGERVVSGWQQSPFVKDGKPMRQDSLLLHYDITETSKIGDEAVKDDNVVRNVLMLDDIYNYVKNNVIL